MRALVLVALAVVIAMVVLPAAGADAGADAASPTGLYRGKAGEGARVRFSVVLDPAGRRRVEGLRFARLRLGCPDGSTRRISVRFRKRPRLRHGRFSVSGTGRAGELLEARGQLVRDTRARGTVEVLTGEDCSASARWTARRR